MKKKDIILRVWGGVGNQLFIYAFAKVLSLITDCKVTLDIRTGFANDGYKRVYRLGDFSISLLPALRFYTLLSFAQRKMPYIRHLPWIVFLRFTRIRICIFKDIGNILILVPIEMFC